MTNIAIREEVAALKRERIIAAAAELFYEQGYEHSTLDAVAERLGMTKPFIYAHFSSKAELLAEICGRGISSAAAAMEEALDLDASATDRLLLFCRGFVTSVLKNQKPIAIFTREEKNLLAGDLKRIALKRRTFDRRLSALLAEGAAKGEFRLADPDLAALAIGGMVSWAYVWYRPDGRLGVETIADELSRLILSMVGGQPVYRSGIDTLQRET